MNYLTIFRAPVLTFLFVDMTTQIKMLFVALDHFAIETMDMVF